MVKKRLKKDRKRLGVSVALEKEEMPYIIIGLLLDGAITLKELDGFSDGLKEMLDYLLELRYR